MTTDTEIVLNKGDSYYVKDEPERLVYLGITLEMGGFYLFAKHDEPGKLYREIPFRKKDDIFVDKPSTEITDDDHIEVVSKEKADAIDAALGIETLTMRIPIEVINAFKEIAKAKGLADYTVAIRHCLTEHCKDIDSTKLIID